MTNTRTAPKKFVVGTWPNARTTGTVAPVEATPDLMGLLGGHPDLDSLRDLHAAIELYLSDQDSKRSVGQRLRDLREHSPYTQEAVADAIHVSLRGYQKMEQTGGISFANLQKLANLFKVDIGHFYDLDQTGSPAALREQMEEPGRFDQQRIHDRLQAIEDTQREIIEIGRAVQELLLRTLPPTEAQEAEEIPMPGDPAAERHRRETGT